MADYVPVACKGHGGAHLSNEEHKACPTCFVTRPEVNCRDCGQYQPDGTCRGIARPATFACTGHTALKGLYP